MTKFKLINTMLLFAVLSGNAVADEVSSKAIYDSKFKTLSLDGILVPFIDEFTGKETDNKGIFDVQLQEKTKLVFELIPWSINFKNTFNGENTSGYILYDHNTRSVKIPCFEVTTIAKFGDAIEGESIYYKDVNMKQRHVAYPIFHVDNMTKTDSCTPTPQKLTSKAQLKGNLSNANVKIYRVEDNADKTLLYQEKTDSDGLFYEHKDELENDKFYIYEVSDGGIEGTIRAVSKGAWITKDFKVSLASEIAYIFLAKDLKYDFNATKVENRLNEVAKTILNGDINEDGNIDVSDLLVFDYQTNLNDINSSEFSSDKLQQIVSEIYRGDLSYADRISSATVGHYNTNGIANSVALSQDETKAFVTDRQNGLVIIDITNPTNPTKVGRYNTSTYAYQVVLSQDDTKAFVANYLNGLVVIDITDPSNPSQLAHYNASVYGFGVSLSKDGTKLFVADNPNGLLIVDITNPSNPTTIGHYNTTVPAIRVTLSQDETKAFVTTGDSHGLVIVDITDPSNPTQIGHYYNKNYFTYGISLSKDGTKAFVTGGSTYFIIVDITDPKNPSKIGQYKAATGNTRGITLSQDGTRAFIADYKNGLVVINITDPSNPRKVNHYNTNEAYEVTLSGDGTKAFVADANNGLVIIDLELFTPISNNSSTK